MCASVLRVCGVSICVYGCVALSLESLLSGPMFTKQSVNDVLTWKYPVKENHVAILAALQLQVRHF